MANKEDGKWVTIRGTHVFIPNGKKVSEVLSSKWKLKGTSKEKHDELRNDLVESRYQKFLKTGDAGYVGDEYSKAKNDLRKASEQGYKEVVKGKDNIFSGYEKFRQQEIGTDETINELMSADIGNWNNQNQAERDKTCQNILDNYEKKHGYKLADENFRKEVLDQLENQNWHTMGRVIEDRYAGIKDQEQYQELKDLDKRIKEAEETEKVEGYDKFSSRDAKKLMEDKHNEMEKKRREIQQNERWAYDDKLKDAYYETFREEERFNAEHKVENPKDMYEPYPAYATYRDKRDKLEGITRDEDGSYNYDNMNNNAEWTGEEYTNDEFLENLEDENWHTERGMLLDAHLTNEQMEFVKNNTTFHNGSPSLDREITEELIKGARGEKYRTPEEIKAQRNAERTDKVTKALKHMEEFGNDGSEVMEGFKYRDYDELKEEYKNLTGEEYKTDYKLNIEPNYKLPNGDVMNQDYIREQYSGYSPEKIQSEIDFEKKTLMSQTPNGRAMAQGRINALTEYLNGMEKYESRISDDFTTGDKKNGYTSGAWQGSKYDGNLDITEIGKNVVGEMKKAYPDVKINRKISRYSGGQSVDFTITESEKPLIRSFDSFSDTELQNIYNTGYNRNYYKTFEDFKDNFKQQLESGEHSVNSYHVSESPELTEYGKAVVKDLHKVINAYNFDDSDGMIDYFHTNFYSDVSIGSYNKPYTVKPSKELRSKINKQFSKKKK